MPRREAFIEIVTGKRRKTIRAHFQKKLRPRPPDQEFQRMDENARRADRQEEIGKKPPCGSQAPCIGLSLQNPCADIGKNGKGARGIEHPAEGSEIGDGTVEGDNRSGQGLRAFGKTWIERNKDQHQHKACRKIHPLETRKRRI